MQAEKITMLSQGLKESFLKWLVLTLLAYLGQSFHYPIFGAIYFSFGGVFLLIILRRFGLLPSLVSFAITLPSLFDGGNLIHALFIMAELVVLDRLLKEKPKDNIAFLDALYWFVVGVPLYLLVHFLFFQLLPKEVWLPLMSLIVNAIFCALLSGLIIQLPKIRKLLGFKQNQNRFYLKQAIFNLLILFLMLPALSITLYVSKQEEKLVVEGVQKDLSKSYFMLEEQISTWLNDRHQKWHELEAMLKASLKGIKQNQKIPNELQRKIEAFLQEDPYLKRIAILDERTAVKYIALKEGFKDKGFDDFDLIFKDIPDFTMVDVNKHISFSTAVFKDVLRYQEELVGFIYLDYDLSFIQEILNKNGNYKNASVEQGLRVMQHSTGLLLLEDGLLVEHEFNKGKSNLAQKELGLWHAPILFNSPLQESLYFQTFQMPQMPNIDFVLTTQVMPYQKRIEQGYVVHLNILLTFLVLALIAAYITSQKVVVPLENLSEVSSHLPDRIRNRQQIDWPETSLVEVASLLHSYQKMSHVMSGTISKLEETKRQLEQEISVHESAQIHTAKQAEMMLNQMSDAVLVVKEMGDIFFVNEKAKELIGLRQDEIFTLKFEQLFSEPEFQQLRYVVQQKLKQQDIEDDYIKISLQKEHGKQVYDVLTNAVLLDKTPAVFMSFRDVSHSDAIEKTLAETQGRFDQVLAALGDPVFILDDNNNIIDVNKNAVDALEQEKNRLLGSSISEFVTEEAYRDFIHTLVALHKSGNTHVSFEMTFMISDYKMLNFDISLSAVSSGENGYIYLLVCRDLSTYKFVQKELYRARNSLQEALEAKSRFLANMSHELRTPMNTVINMVDEINRKVKDKDLEISAAKLDIASETLLELVEDMFEHAQMDVQKIDLAQEPVHLSELLNQVYIAYRLHAEEQDISIKVNHPKQPIEPIVSDGTRLKQIFLKIVSTLLQVQNKGVIDIDIDYKNDPENKNALLVDVVFTNKSELVDEGYLEHLQSILTDTDAGLSQEYKGVGLAIVLVRQIVEHMGLTLTLESEEKGLKFTLSGAYRRILKERTKKKQELGLEEMLLALKEREAIKVLNVDDSPDNRFIVKMLLKDIDAEITEAENGEEAIRAFFEQDYDIVLMDMLMPVVDGYEAASRIKKQQLEEESRITPILALTANALKEDEQRCIDAGCDAYLAKPIKKETLISKIYHLLHSEK